MGLLKVEKIADIVEHSSNFASKLSRQNAYRRKVAFMHVPKCAGSSIMEGIRRHSKSSWQGHVDGPSTRATYSKYFVEPKSFKTVWDLEQDILKYRQTVLLERFKDGFPIVSGHVPFLSRLKENYPDYFFFTVIRNPTERWLSYFNFCIEKDKHPGITKDFVHSKGMSYVLDKVLDSEMGALEGRLLNLFFSEAGKYYLKPTEQRPYEEMSLGMFDYIGLTDDMNEVVLVLQQHKILRQHESIGQHNRTNLRSKSVANITLKDMSARQKSLLEDLCKDDLSLYEKILQLRKYKNLSS